MSKKIKFFYSTVQLVYFRMCDICSIFCRLKTLFPPLKGQCHEIFATGLFRESSSPQASDNSVRVIYNFFENNTGGKFATNTASVVDTDGKLPPVSLTPAANFQ
jgi:hypothetical protein